MKPLRMEGLTKEFRMGLRGRRILALDRLDLEVEQGEIFWFWGPQTAGYFGWGIMERSRYVSPSILK